MKKSTYEAAIEAAESLDLSERSVTGAINGYPAPCVGVFIGRFEDFEQAEDFVNKHGGDIRVAHWRDGWHVVELGGTLYKAFEPKSEDYGSEYFVADSEEDLYNEAWYAFNEREKSDEEISKMDAEEKNNYDEKMQELKEHAEKLMGEGENFDWKKESMILCEGEFWKTVPKESMTFSFDTHHYEIGVWLSNDFEEEEIEEETEEETARQN